jgi:2-deoxy-D-gluconate 3-dehydrogenase
MDASISNFSMDMFSLKGKVAMVTGGNTHLGMAYASAFAKAGADLFIPHLTDDVRDIRDFAEKEGRRIAFIQGDLTDPSFRKALVDKCLEVYGKIDILVNNAGVSKRTLTQYPPEEVYQRVIDLNITAAYDLCCEIGQIMKKQGGGKIINIGSTLSFTGSGGDHAYPISKHAVIGMTRSIAAEFLHDNVKCNAICPGFFRSPLNEGMPQESFDRVARRLPHKEWGSYGDLMGSAVFLASSASDYVNGVFLIVDGGFAANYF